MSDARRTQIQLRERLNDLNKQLLTLEWDKEHNQLNAGMETKYNELKEEHDKIVEKLDGTTKS